MAANGSSDTALVDVDPLAAEFQHLLAAGSFTVPWCPSCERSFWYPRSRCPTCGAKAVELRPSAGSGTVYATTIVRRQPPGLPSELLGAMVGYVTLDEGPKVLAALLGFEDDHRAAIGHRVRVELTENGLGYVFRCAESELRAGS